MKVIGRNNSRKVTWKVRVKYAFTLAKVLDVLARAQKETGNTQIRRQNKGVTKTQLRHCQISRELSQRDQVRR